MIFNNILVTIPQTLFGFYVDKNWRVIAKQMMEKNYSSKHIPSVTLQKKLF